MAKMKPGAAELANNEFKARLRSAYSITEKRKPADIEAIKDAMKEGDLPLIDELITQILNEQNDFLVRVKESTGMQGNEFCDAFGWLPEQENRMLGNGIRNQSITLQASAIAAQNFGVSVTTFAFGSDCLPIVVPRKHQAWMNALKYMPPETKTAIARQIDHLADSKTIVLQTVADYRSFAYRRAREQCESRGIVFENLFADTYPELDRPRRKAMHSARRQEMLYSQTPVMYTIAIALNCALDYFAIADYTKYEGKFIDEAGNDLRIDRPNKRILGALANCGDEVLVNKIIGCLCAGMTDLTGLEEDQGA